MKITGAGTIKIMREKASDTPAAGVLTSGALFANHVVAGTNAADWSVNLMAYDGERTESSSYPGLIGVIEEGANVSVTFTNSSEIPVEGSGNTGLICTSTVSIESLRSAQSDTLFPPQPPPVSSPPSSSGLPNEHDFVLVSQQDAN